MFIHICGSCLFISKFKKNKRKTVVKPLIGIVPSRGKHAQGSDSCVPRDCYMLRVRKIVPIPNALIFVNLTVSASVFKLLFQLVGIFLSPKR